MAGDWGRGRLLWWCSRAPPVPRGYRVSPVCRGRGWLPVGWVWMVEWDAPPRSRPTMGTGSESGKTVRGRAWLVGPHPNPLPRERGWVIDWGWGRRMWWWRRAPPLPHGYRVSPVCRRRGWLPVGWVWSVFGRVPRHTHHHGSPIGVGEDEKRGGWWGTHPGPLPRGEGLAYPHTPLRRAPTRDAPTSGNE